MFSLATQAFLLCSVSARTLWQLPRQDAGTFSIEIPAQEARDPHNCESFETTNYDDIGCLETCTVYGFFGSFRFQDAQARKTTKCKSYGSSCRTSLLVHAEMNVTSSNGRCNQRCQCEVSTNLDDEAVQTANVLRALIANRRHARLRHDVQNGLNEVGLIKLRVPPAHERNSSKCEDYETPGFMATNVPAERQCQDYCFVQGSIGNLQFESVPRYLSTVKNDASYCELKVEEGNSKFIIKGSQQMIAGVCYEGVCRPADWKKPEETKNPEETKRPEEDAMEINEIHVEMKLLTG